MPLDKDKIIEQWSATGYLKGLKGYEGGEVSRLYESYPKQLLSDDPEKVAAFNATQMLPYEQRVLDEINKQLIILGREPLKHIKELNKLYNI